MKKIFCLVLIAMMVLGSLARAFVVESAYRQNQTGAYVKEVVVRCEASEQNDCYTICGANDQCRRKEPYCLNCAGTTSPLLRQLFTEIAKLYKTTSTPMNKDHLVRYLANETYVLLGAKSIFNYYRPVDSAEFMADLAKLCPSASEDPLLAVGLNSENQPTKLNFILCRPQGGASVAFEVQPRTPEIGVNSLSTPIDFKLF